MDALSQHQGRVLIRIRLRGLGFIGFIELRVYRDSRI